MPDILTPLLAQFETILETNYNSEINNIDATLPNLGNDKIVIEDFDLIVPGGYPYVQIFPRPGEHEVDSDRNITDVFVYEIVTSIQIVGSSSKQLIAELSKYLSAMSITIAKGTGAAFHNLDGMADILRLVSWGHEDFVNVETNELVKGGFIIWRVETELDLAA